MRGISTALATAFLAMAAVFALKTYADTVFLDAYGVAYVPHLFVALAAASIGGASAYSWVLRRGNAAALDYGLLAAAAACSFAAPVAVARGGAWVFAVALVLSALPALANLAAWTAVTATVTGRRARTFVPRASAAATIGAVLGGFASSGAVGAFGMNALAYFGGGLSLATLAARVSLERHRRARVPAPVADTALTRPRVGLPREARALVWLLVAATALEALVSAVVDFGFKREAAGAFDERGLGMFLALFYGASNVAVLALQLFATTRVLASRALRRTLSVPPATLAVAGAAWLLAPGVALATVARAAEGVLKFGLARPAQEIALAPLPELERQRWKVLIRGAFAQVGAAAAGLLLIGVEAVIVVDAGVVPGLILALAVGWLVTQRAVARAYLANLGTAIGLRRMQLDTDGAELALDREGVARVIGLMGSGDPALARFGRELLAAGELDATVLAEHIEGAPPAVRAALFRLAAARPHPHALPALRAAMAGESDPEAELAGLAALAAHGDASAAARAADIAGDNPAGADARARDAWAYLAQVGELDGDAPEDGAPALHRALRALIASDGARAAQVADAALQRGAITGGELDALIGELASAAGEHVRRNALIAGAALGRFAPLAHVLRAVRDGDRAADEALPHLDALGLFRLVGLASARQLDADGRARLLRGLRGSDLPEVAELAASYLGDDAPEVRAVATRTLLKHARERDADIPRAPVEAALRAELELLDRYARARPGYPEEARESYMLAEQRLFDARNATRASLFEEELERRCERALGRLCALLALLAPAETVYAAERALRAPELKQRRQAVDLLQEVAVGADRARLFEVLERYLLPPTRPDPAARAAACAADLWLARCDRGDLDDLVPRLAALRTTTLFRRVDGIDLAELATAATERSCAAGELIVEQGAPGDALYVVMDGALAIEVDGRRVSRLPAGEAFGELALLDGQPRSATVRAIEATRLLVVPRDAFRAALAEHPSLGLGLVRGLARWLRDSLDPLTALSSTSIPRQR